MNGDNNRLAYELLRSLCDDILDQQIAFRWFWPDYEALSKDAFADYVHYWLRKASLRMEWTHHDSSHIWEAKR